MLTLLCENSAKGHHVQSVQEGQVPVMSPAVVRVFFFSATYKFLEEWLISRGKSSRAEISLLGIPRFPLGALNNLLTSCWSE